MESVNPPEGRDDRCVEAPHPDGGRSGGAVVAAN
jgi:hypothetical protein